MVNQIMNMQTTEIVLYQAEESTNHQLVALQQHVDERFLRIEDRLQRHDEQLDFFIRTSTPPAEMVFFNGDFFTTRVAALKRWEEIK